MGKLVAAALLLLLLLVVLLLLLLRAPSLSLSLPRAPTEYVLSQPIAAGGRQMPLSLLRRCASLNERSQSCDCPAAHLEFGMFSTMCLMMPSGSTSAAAFLGSKSAGLYTKSLPCSSASTTGAVALTLPFRFRPAAGWAPQANSTQSASLATPRIFSWVHGAAGLESIERRVMRRGLRKALSHNSDL